MDKLKSLFKGNPFFFILIVLLPFGFVFYLIWTIAKKNAQEKFKDVPIPKFKNNGNDLTADFKSTTAVTLAKEVFDAIDGVFYFWKDKNTVLNKLSILSDDQLLYVYYVYNNAYATKAFWNFGDVETMTAALDGEVDNIDSDLRDRITTRLVTLGAT